MASGQFTYIELQNQAAFPTRPSCAGEARGGKTPEDDGKQHTAGPGLPGEHLDGGLLMVQEARSAFRADALLQHLPQCAHMGKDTWTRGLCPQSRPPSPPGGGVPCRPRASWACGERGRQAALQPASRATPALLLQALNHRPGKARPTPRPAPRQNPQRGLQCSLTLLQKMKPHLLHGLVLAKDGDDRQGTMSSVTRRQHAGFWAVVPLRVG